MTWNYRVMRHGELYIIHEVYYMGDSFGWSENGACVVSDTPDDLREILSKMTEALSKDILDYKTGNPIPKERADIDNLPLWQQIQKITNHVPAEEWEKIPRNLAKCPDVQSNNPQEHTKDKTEPNTQPNNPDVTENPLPPT